MKWRCGKGGFAGGGGIVIKLLPHPFAFEGFWETAPRFAPLRILRNGVVGRYLGFRATTARIAHFLPQFVTAHRIFADFSVIH